MKLTDEEILVLRLIARWSKMDCWFSIDSNGVIRDLENKGLVRVNQKRSIKQLIGEFQKEDFMRLKDSDKYVLFNLMTKLC